MSSKKTNHSESESALPPELSAAIDAAEAVLRQYDPLNFTLKQTAHDIPLALREEQRVYLSSDGGAALAAVREKRRDAARRRTIAAEALVELADDLAKARDAVRAAQAAFARSVIAEFHQRWQRCCAELAKMHAEAAQLSAILRVTVTCPSPYVASTNLITQRPEVCFAGERVAPEAPSAALAGLVEVLDRVDAAAGLSDAIRRGREQTARHHALARVRAGMPSEMTGVWEVRKGFDFHGVEYLAGTLVDRSVLSDNDLYRLNLARNILRADVEAAVA